MSGNCSTFLIKGGGLWQLPPYMRSPEVQTSHHNKIAGMVVVSPPGVCNASAGNSPADISPSMIGQRGSGWVQKAEKGKPAKEEGVGGE